MANELVTAKDLQGLAKTCVSQMEHELPPEMSGIDAETVYALIERIDRAETELATMRAENARNVALIEELEMALRNLVEEDEPKRMGHELHSEWQDRVRKWEAAHTALRNLARAGYVAKEKP